MSSIKGIDLSAKFINYSASFVRPRKQHNSWIILQNLNSILFNMRAYFCVAAVLLLAVGAIAADFNPGDCEKPVDSGKCLANLPKFHYNVAKNECETFTYGGCDGNENRFETKEECEKKCKH